MLGLVSSLVSVTIDSQLTGLTIQPKAKTYFSFRSSWPLQGKLQNTATQSICSTLILWAVQRFALLALGRAWTLFGSRENSKRGKCSKKPQNPQRPVHALLGAIDFVLRHFRNSSQSSAMPVQCAFRAINSKVIIDNIEPNPLAKISNES